jgi:hypothetical protein
MFESIALFLLSVICLIIFNLSLLLNLLSFRQLGATRDARRRSVFAELGLSKEDSSRMKLVGFFHPYW